MILLIKLTTAAALSANRGGFIEPGEASPEFQKLILILLLLAVVLSAIFTLLDIRREKKRLK